MDIKRIRFSLFLLLGIISFGTIGYYLAEGMSLFEAFYMTVITISTVGFAEVKPLHLLGRLITMVIIITGTATLAYTIGTILKLFIEGEISKSFGRKKLETQITKLRNHYIICGYGRIGSVLCKVLLSHSIDFVVIECNPESVENLEKEKMLFIPMDATDEEALEKAGIAHARGLVTAVHSDADNVYITLSARGLRPDLFILSRASDEKAVQKLKKAGATRVVTPYQLGGRRMAQEIIRPTVVDFIDSTTMDMKFGLVMEEAKVRAGSSFIGKTLIQSNLRKDFGVIIVAIRQKDGKMIFNPTSEHTLNIDDIIVVLGKKDDVERMINVL